jgi:hypothetical protein
MNSPQEPLKDIPSLFRPLDNLLINALHELTENDWNKPTSAKYWNVKDVASHLLDGNLRALSIQRDRYFGELPPPSPDYTTMVQWLNGLNADWVKATKRLSPDVILMLHEITGPMVTAYYESLSPMDEAIFPVQWAGENKSYNWMHLAREYTEKWHHQQQIRDVITDYSLMTPEFYVPYMDTTLHGLPSLFQKVESRENTSIQIHITGQINIHWALIRTSSYWELKREKINSPNATVIISPEIAWKLFSKNIRSANIINDITITGDLLLANRVLELVAVMA